MSKERIRFLVIGTAIGAAIGMAVAWLATDAKNEELRLASDGNAVSIRPDARQWVSFAVAAVTLLRQFSNMIEPRVD